jgi:hypothetical protein
MRRYFMLIPEAVELVLHAAAQGQAGDIYVLKMGEQIPLVDMARNLIRLAGFVPDEDIPITFTGIRPGEKLHEELIGPDEAMELAGAANVMRVQPLRLPSAEVLTQQIAELERRAKNEDVAGVLEQLRATIPELNATPESRAEVVGQTLEAPLPLPSRPSTHQKCPRCASANIHRSRPRSWAERVKKDWTYRRPYRCRDCNWRGWLVPLDHIPVEVPADAGAETVDLTSIDAAVQDQRKRTRPAFSPRSLH